jgi:ABC-type transport system substrate-binding protein
MSGVGFRHGSMRRMQSMNERLGATLLCLLTCAFAVPCSNAADPGKTLRVVFSIAETSFDPQFASDAASDSVIGSIYDPMIQYDYLARPVRLVPRTLEAMPVIEDGGKTYVCRRGE